MCLHCVQEPIAQAPMQVDVSRTCSVLFYYARGSTRTYSGCGLVASRTHLGDSKCHLHLFPPPPYGCTGRQVQRAQRRLHTDVLSFGLEYALC